MKYSGARKKIASHRRPGASSRYGIQRRGIRIPRRWAVAPAAVIGSPLGPDDLLEALVERRLVGRRELVEQMGRGQRLGVGEDELVIGQLRVLLREDLLDALDRRHVVDRLRQGCL